MRPISIKPSEEKGSATITVGDQTMNVTTEEASGLLLRLAEVRPMLLPQPPLEDQPPQPRPLVALCHRFWVHANHAPEGGVLLSLPNPAVGWMTWHIPPDVTLQMVQLMQLWRVPPQPVPPVPIPG